MNEKTVIAKNNRLRMGVNRQEAIALGIDRIITSDKENPSQQVAYYDRHAQKRLKWFALDLETGDHWIPESDEVLQSLITAKNDAVNARDHLDPAAEDYNQQYKEFNDLIKSYLDQMAKIYNEHPAFIRGHK